MSLNNIYIYISAEQFDFICLRPYIYCKIFHKLKFTSYKA